MGYFSVAVCLKGFYPKQCDKMHKSEKTVYLSFLLCQFIASQQEAIPISEDVLTLYELPVTSSMI